jgi:hypothetical protein
MKTLWRILTSLKTCVWTGLAFTLAGAAGSFVMGRFPGLFSDMDAQVFSGWIARKGFVSPAATSWLYGLLFATLLFAVNAACCTADRLVKIFRGKATLRAFMPHVMHLAFIGVILSHLVGAAFGDRNPGVAVPQGGFAPVGGTGWVLGLDRIAVVPGDEGYPRDFQAAVTLYRETTPVARGIVRANEPLFHEGYGFYIKTFGTAPWGAPYAVFDANRDPGAVPILVSSLLFTAANLCYLLPARRVDG